MFRPLATTLILGAVVLAKTARGQEARRDEPPPAAATPILTRPPELLEGAEPAYPTEAERRGLEADVPVRIWVDASGAVLKAEVIGRAGHGFDEAALEAVKRYRFRPAEFDGKPGPIVVETTLHFRLRRPAPGPEGGAIAPEQAGDAPEAAERPDATGTLRGVILERGTRRRLAGVVVGVVGTDLEATTDSEGRFTLPGVPAGARRLVVLASGFDRLDESVAIGERETVEITLYLRPEGGNPYETYVEGERERLEVTKRTVERRQITTVPGTFGDPLRVIQNLPGMARSPYLSGLLLIRGSNPDDSGVYIDGHEIPLLYHFLGGPSILNPEFLETIDMYPGGFPTRYGRAIGGVIEVATRPTASDGLHGSADVDLIDSGLYLRTPLGQRASLAVAGRRSYVDTVLPVVLPDPDPGDTLVVVPVYWDYQARLDVDLPGPGSLSMLVFGSDDKLDFLSRDVDDQETIDLDSHIGFHRVIASYRTPLARTGLQLTISPAVGRDVVSFTGGERTGLDVTQTVFALRERATGELSRGLRLDAGLDLEYRLTDYTALAPNEENIRVFGEEPDIPLELIQRSADLYGLAAFADVAWDVGRLRLIPGLRIDGYFLSGEPRASVDPRLVARFRIDDPTTLKAYVGLFHQPPAPEGLDSRFGNPELGLERAVHTGVGVERRLGRALALDVEVYYVDRRDLAVFTGEVRMQPDGTIDPLFWANEAKGRTYGLELLLRHDVTRRFYGWVSYTLSRAEIQRHPDEEPMPVTWDQTHNLVGVASYRTDGGWEIGAKWRVTTGRPETPVLGATYDADDDDYRPLRGEPRSARRPTFHQLDVRAEKTWLFRTWRLGAYLDVINVYNAENPEATEYDYRYRETAPVRGMPIVPTVGVRGQW